MIARANEYTIIQIELYKKITPHFERMSSKGLDKICSFVILCFSRAKHVLVACIVESFRYQLNASTVLWQSAILESLQ